mgnify:CR=1 FL=1
MFIFARFIVFNVMGRDYDAAVLAAGTCGFGMGATPNAMANMQAVCEKYVPSVKAYLLIPLVGSLFADFLNSLVITFFFINIWNISNRLNCFFPAPSCSIHGKDRYVHPVLCT